MRDGAPIMFADPVVKALLITGVDLLLASSMLSGYVTGRVITADGGQRTP